MSRQFDSLGREAALAIIKRHLKLIGVQMERIGVPNVEALQFEILRSTCDHIGLTVGPDWREEYRARGYCV